MRKSPVSYPPTMINSVLIPCATDTWQILLCLLTSLKNWWTSVVFCSLAFLKSLNLCAENTWRAHFWALTFWGRLMEMPFWGGVPVRATKLSLASGCQSAASDCVVPWFNFNLKVETGREGRKEWQFLPLKHLSLQFVSKWIVAILGFASCGSLSLLQSVSCGVLCWVFFLLLFVLLLKVVWAPRSLNQEWSYFWGPSWRPVSSSAVGVSAKLLIKTYLTYTG